VLQGGGTRKKKHINAIVRAERQVRRTCAFLNAECLRLSTGENAELPLLRLLAHIYIHNIRARSLSLSTSLFSPPSTLCSTVASAEHAARSPEAKNTLRRAKQGEPIHNRAPLPLETLLQCVRTVRCCAASTRSRQHLGTPI
jgi:hypothetical protein